MAATLLAVIAALAIGHLAPAFAAGLRRFDWFRAWLRWLDAQFPADGVWRGPYGIALALVVPLLPLALLQIGAMRALWGLPGLLLGVAALAWCWGPRDLDSDVEAILDGRKPAKPEVPQVKLSTSKPKDYSNFVGKYRPRPDRPWGLAVPAALPAPGRPWALWHLRVLHRKKTAGE